MEVAIADCVFVLEIVLLWVLCTTYNVIARNTTKETEEKQNIRLDLMINCHVVN